MKKIKILLLAAALLGASATAHAQQDWSVSVGYAMNHFRGPDCSPFLSKHTLSGFYAGVRREFYFSALAGLTFEPGLLFYYQSCRNALETTPKYIKMHYLSMPLDVKYTFGVSGGTTASFFTGPVFNMGLFGNVYEKGKIATIRDQENPHRNLTRGNIQWDFGVAFTIADAVQLRVAYALGLSRLVPEQEFHSNTLSVGASLLF
ncbi:MAG: PorT family protein [Bacteroidales bacterium]|nr:PorT family protein [Bacteroidales bacterium]